MLFPTELFVAGPYSREGTHVHPVELQPPRPCDLRHLQPPQDHLTLSHRGHPTG